MRPWVLSLLRRGAVSSQHNDGLPKEITFKSWRNISQNSPEPTCQSVPAGQALERLHGICTLLQNPTLKPTVARRHASERKSRCMFHHSASCVCSYQARELNQSVNTHADLSLRRDCLRLRLSWPSGRHRVATGLPLSGLIMDTHARRPMYPKSVNHQSIRQVVDALAGVSLSNL